MEIPNSPFTFFNQWFKEHQATNPIEPEAFVLATATKDAAPSARVVLLKKVTEEGFYFFTNLLSQKGQELKENPQAAMCFYWPALKRQVRIEGIVEAAPQKESDLYFAQRPRGSQLGAWASKQSFPMEDKDSLVKRLDEFAKKFKNDVIPRPPFWGGFIIKPTSFEFWEEGEFRLHKRLRFQKTGCSWNYNIIYP